MVVGALMYYRFSVQFPNITCDRVCYELNVCIHHNLYVEVLNPNVMVFGGGVLGI